MMDMANSAIPIGSYLKIVFRRKHLIVTLTFAGLILGLCVGMVLPKKFKSSTVILVQEGKTDNPMFDKLAVSTTVQQRMVGIRETILGWNSLTEIVKRLDLAKDIQDKPEYEKLIDALRKNILIRLQGNNLIFLEYTGDDAVKTQAVVQSITDILIEKNMQVQTQETADAIKFIEEQLQVYKGKIRSAEIAQLEDQLKSLLVDSTEKHPLVKQLQDQITQKKDQLKKDNLEYTNNIQLGAKTFAPMLSEIQKALSSLETPDRNTAASVQAGSPVAPSVDYADQNSLAKVMLLDKLENVMARDVRVNEEIYNTLLQRLETAKITQRLQTSKEGTRYTIVDPPRVPLRPFQPNLVLVAFMGLFLGLATGIGLILAEEFLDQSFLDVEEAKSHLGVPLLGAISKITTEQAVRDERERQRWFYIMVFVAGMLLLVSTMAVTKLAH